MTRAPARIRGRLDEIADSDPRVSGEYLRLITEYESPILLVGVAHDHPASIYRVGAIVEALQPEVLALELPDFVLPVLDPFKYPGDGPSGEMAAAIAAASTRRVIGIDVPSRGTVRALLRESLRQRVGLGTVFRTVRSIVNLSARAILVRATRQLSQLGLPWNVDPVKLAGRHEYDLVDDSSPAAQAENETSHLQRSEALFQSFEPPTSMVFLDAVRERCMADRLDSLSSDGFVIGVVGYGHLDGLESVLAQKTG